MNSLPLRSVALSALLVVLPADAAVTVYLSNPANQLVDQSDFSSDNDYSFLTETFNALSAGDFSGIAGAVSGNTGTYSISGGTPSIESNASYGGGTGQGNYLSISADEYVTIEFDTPVNYFGFQWTAGNAGNRVTLFDELGLNLGTFDTETITSLLSGPNITALNGSVYDTADYFGVPGDRGTTSHEPFGYVHLVNEGGTGISRIVLSHTGGGAFENDNHSIRVAKVNVDHTGTLVEVGAVVPEPSVAGLLAAMGLMAGLRRSRPRR